MTTRCALRRAFGNAGAQPASGDSGVDTGPERGPEGASGLRERKVPELLLTNRQYAFARMEGEDEVIAVLNNDGQEAQVSFPVPSGGAVYEDCVSGETYAPAGGRISLTLAPCGSLVLVRAGADRS